jgi:hypothetical protein
MTMQEALKQVSELCPDASHKCMTVSLNVDQDESFNKPSIS